MHVDNIEEMNEIEKNEGALRKRILEKQLQRRKAPDAEKESMGRRLGDGEGKGENGERRLVRSHNRERNTKTHVKERRGNKLFASLILEQVLTDHPRFIG
jgi:hypothetical protein